MITYILLIAGWLIFVDQIEGWKDRRSKRR